MSTLAIEIIMSNDVDSGVVSYAAKATYHSLYSGYDTVFKSGECGSVWKAVHELACDICEFEDREYNAYYAIKDGE